MLTTEYVYVVIVLEQSKPAKNPDYVYNPNYKDLDRYSSVPLEPKRIAPTNPTKVTRAYERRFVKDAHDVRYKVTKAIQQIQAIEKCIVYNQTYQTGADALAFAEKFISNDPANFVCQNGKTWLAGKNK